jgi:monofunctional biosynthetic peptidoglycan transglycosylase
MSLREEAIFLTPHQRRIAQWATIESSYDSKITVVSIFKTVLFITAMNAQVFASDYTLPSEKLHFEHLKPRSRIEQFDENGRSLGFIGSGDIQIYKGLSQISKNLQNFVIWAEDAKFYSHEGFDVAELKNAISQTIGSGKLGRGASTITQQLAKNLFLNREKSFTRKLYEIPWAIRLEKDFTKNQILELYLNVVEWGRGIRGAEAAARYYFDKPASDLTEVESLYLSLILPNPKRMDMQKNPKSNSEIQSRKLHLLKRLVQEKKILRDDFNQLSHSNPEFKPLTSEGRHFKVHNTPPTAPISNRDPSKQGSLRRSSFKSSN